jgi:hypothetical protein
MQSMLKYRAGVVRKHRAATRRKMADSTQEQERLAVMVSPLNVQADCALRHKLDPLNREPGSSAMQHTVYASPVHELSPGIPIITTPSFHTLCSPLLGCWAFLQFGGAHLHHAGNKCQPNSCSGSLPCAQICFQQLTSILDFRTA